jgi:membrane protein YdbS with pleckstrin-like domain
MIIIAVGLVAVLTICVWLFFPLETNEKVGLITAISTVALAIITAIYAWYTRKMAKEMQEQRKDVFRPIIAFERDETPTSMIQEGIDIETGNLTSGIRCRLHNIGVGPALGVFSNIQDTNKKQQLTDFGILPVDGQTDANNFSVIVRDNKDILAVRYKDTFGRKFESSINIHIAEEGICLVMEELQIRELD